MFESSSSISEHFKQKELSSAIRGLNLAKEAAEILTSQLKDKYCLRTGASITFCHTKEKELLPHFSKKEKLDYCKDIEKLLLKMAVPQYRAQE